MAWSLFNQSDFDGVGLVAMFKFYLTNKSFLCIYEDPGLAAGVDNSSTLFS